MRAGSRRPTARTCRQPAVQRCDGDLHVSLPAKRTHRLRPSRRILGPEMSVPLRGTRLPSQQPSHRVQLELRNLCIGRHVPRCGQRKALGVRVRRPLQQAAPADSRTRHASADQSDADDGTDPEGARLSPCRPNESCPTLAHTLCESRQHRLQRVPIRIRRLLHRDLCFPCTAQTAARGRSPSLPGQPQDVTWPSLNSERGSLLWTPRSRRAAEEDATGAAGRRPARGRTPTRACQKRALKFRGAESLPGAGRRRQCLAD